MSRTRPRTGAERRAMARARAERARRLRRRTGRVLLAVSGLLGIGFIALAVWGVWAVLHRPGPAGHLPPESTLDAYRISYRVLQPAAPEATELHEVQRPFLGRYETTTGGALSSGSLTNADGTWLYLTSGTPGWVRLTTTKARAAGDAHVGGGLAEALRQGLARVTGRTTVAGHPCTVVRTGGPVGSPVIRPTGRDHADICVDEHGVMLSERWVLSGRVARTRTATSYDPAPQYQDDAWTARPQNAPDPAFSAAAPRVVALTDTQLATLTFSLVPPNGFSAEGAFSQVTTTGSRPSAQVIEHFVRGSDLIDLLQSSAPPGAGGAHGRQMSVAGLGQVTVEADLNAVAVEYRLADGTFARLSGSDAGKLLAAAAGLRHKPPGG